MAFHDIYFCIGAVCWVLTSVAVLIALGRFAFQTAFHEYPSLRKCHVIPGIPLVGSDDLPWALIAIINVICYVVIGSFGFLLLWPVLILVLINGIINSSRKKRFG